MAYASAGNRLRRVIDPRLFDTPFQSPQMFLWEPGLADWHLVLRLPEYVSRRRVGNLAVQPPLFELESEWAGAP